jgi:hypothetical protein
MVEMMKEYIHAEIEGSITKGLFDISFYNNWTDDKGDDYIRHICTIYRVPEAQANAIISACNQFVDTPEGAMARYDIMEVCK